MQSGDYGGYDAYDAYGGGGSATDQLVDDDGFGVTPGGGSGQHGHGGPHQHVEVNYDDPKISSMPKILLMGPRRGGKTSIQVRKERERRRSKKRICYSLPADAHRN